MAGKRGMNRDGRMGGARTPKGGRPKTEYKFKATKGQTLIIERETIGGEIAQPEAWVFLECSEGGREMTLQRNNEILTIRHPENSNQV